MMSKKDRLTRADFKSFRAIRREHGTLFTLSIGPVTTKTKYACVVSKKVSLKATERNAVKRRCRAALSAALAKAPAPHTLIFHAKPAARSASFRMIAEEVGQLLACIK